MPRVWLIGAGRMGGAMLDGWVRVGAVALSDLVIFDPTPGPEALAAAAAGAVLNPDPVSATVPVPDVLVVAVKPQVWRSVVTPLAARLPAETMVLSVAAGVRFATLAEVFGTRPLVRAMPNTPGAIGAGATGYVLGQGTDKQSDAWARRLLQPLGLLEKLGDESLIDAVAALSGSGPAYVFLMVEALAAAGAGAGLPPAQAMRLARQTVIGSGALLAHDKRTPNQMREAVTSPGGTTQAALDTLMDGGGLAMMMRRAVEANMRRSKELGRDDRA